ncbi:DUF4917 family protein [Francisella hispaniensis]|uniref:DUF4917 domain-containing protein n=1 Tax=Francisella hispaniensis TaxID=622488 RepID=F4BK89_9GAMM|nr:DUF4917 family protein [Francisella hispaniensis]AEB28583.1 hypothetical protein FN3523_0726 [Francisella hispaniensis]
MSLLTYQEVQERTLGQQNILLLGNGFSMSYNYERFSFTSLLDSAVSKGLVIENSPVYKVFSKFSTTDFEEVINLLENSVRVIKEYGIIAKEDETKILDDSEKLKKHLVNIITNNHSDKITEIEDDEFYSCANFIKDYEKIYTLNYDLLLYWTCIKLKKFIDDRIVKQFNLKVSDGFSSNSDDFEQLTYRNDSKVSSSIFYLHGALHIFDKKSEIIKTSYSQTGVSLKEQTLDFLQKNIYPVFVSEGTDEQKKAKIIHNAYLNHCYKSLATIGKKNSNLIVFGTMLKTNDNHIREAILKNKISNIYISVSSEAAISALDGFVEEANKLSKEVFFYDYKTVKVWR